MSTSSKKTNQQLLTDIGLRLVDSRALSIYRSRSTEKREVVNRKSVMIRDLDLVSGRDNLAQAISIRLLTQKGELAALAHPDFGSRLPELIGQPLTDTTRNLAKLYVIESLKQEKRIESILDVSVTSQPWSVHQMNLSIRVKPVDDSEPLDLGPIQLEL